MQAVWCALLGYLIGSVNPSWLLARVRGSDIRTVGSGNAGASNAVIVFGKAAGAVCALLDIGKAWLAVYLAETLFPDFPQAFALTGAACILGHIYSLLLHFRGGKGFACLGGIILYFDWRVFLICLVCALLLALITDYICFVPTSVSLVFTGVYAGLRRDLPGALFLLIAALAVLARHVENFRRIAVGTELRFSYLWRGGAELERVKRNIERQTGAPAEGLVPPARRGAEV